MINENDLYMGGFKPKSIFHRVDAANRIESLGDAERIVVSCDYTGKSNAELFVGRNADGPFVAVKDSNGEHAFLTGDDEAALFGVAVNFIEFQQGFVNSDPRSPDYFEPSLDSIELREKIVEAFGVKPT